MPTSTNEVPPLQQIARELYGLRPDEFTPARDARASASSQTDTSLSREIKRLRKPTNAAWALNQLIREYPDEVAQLVGLGAAFREAQTAFSTEQLRALEPQRRQILAQITQRATDVAAEGGIPLSAAAVAEVGAALHAAMADESAGSALCAGLLIRTFGTTGLGPADLAGSVAIADAIPMIEPAAPTTAGQGETETVRASGQPAKKAGLRAAQQALDRSEKAVNAADADVSKALAAIDAAALRRESLERERQDVQATLSHLNEQLATAKAEEAEAKSELRRAEKGLSKAKQEASKQAARLEELKGSLES